MGGIVSTGHNNDDLIDNLLEVDYIKTSSIERVFRAVDRAEYFLPEGRESAYKDVAWKCGNLHLSAPCIYSEVMEGLCLEPGLAFLNLGSGTGYLSTMAGLILGKDGINHGVEYYEDVIQYANKKLEEFKRHSGAIDEYDFCEPSFVRGNCLCLSETTRLYDRVYCGASCPLSFEPYMKNLLKIGGILVVPINEHLMQFKRVSEVAWTSKTLLPVSFASLIQPPDGSQEIVQPIEVQPMSLQALSRVVIRAILRRGVELELPPLPRREQAPRRAPRKKRVLKRLIVPLFDDDDDDDDDEEEDDFEDEEDRQVADSSADEAPPRGGGDRRRNHSNNNNNGFVFETRNGLRGRAARFDYDNIFSHVIDTLRFRQQHRVREGARRGADTDEAGTQTAENGGGERNKGNKDNGNGQNGGDDDDNESDAGVAMDVGSEKDSAEMITDDDVGANTTTASMVVNDGSVCSDISCEEHKRDLNLDPSCWAECSESEATTSRASRSNPKKGCERKKFDSGIGDDNDLIESVPEDDHEGEEDEDDTANEKEEDEDEDIETDDGDQSKKGKRSLSLRTVMRDTCRKNRPKWRRIALEPSFSSSDTENDSDRNHGDEDGEMRMYQSRFSAPMREKIKELPLPQVLKNYLNFYREF